MTHESIANSKLGVEKWAITSLAVTVSIHSWWLGSTTVAGQIAGCVSGSLALILAIVSYRNRQQASRLHPQLAPNKAVINRTASNKSQIISSYLAIGIFLGLLLCQALNPDRLLIPDMKPLGQLSPLQHINWLPTGIKGPFAHLPNDHLYFANSWHHLLLAACVLFQVGTIILLANRASIVKTFLELIILHAAIFSTFAFVHNLSGSKAALWLVTDANFHLGAPQFLAKNQQAAYQVLLLAVCLAASVINGATRPWPTLPNRNWLLYTVTLLVFLGTVTTRSRAGILGASILILSTVFFQRNWHIFRILRRPLPLLTIFFVLAASLSLPPARATLARFSETFRERKTFLSGGQFRNILHSIAWKMTLDKPWFGHGAGCYILLFTEYHPKVPEYMDSIKRDHPTTHRILHSHADGDWIEFTAEYGLIGTALLAIPWVAWLLRLFQFRPLHPAVIILSLGVGFVLIHGWFDFVLRNPAILGLTGVLAVVAISTARINTLNPSEKLTPTAPITAASA